MESGGGGGGLSRRRTFSDNTVDASNLRDLLRVRDDEDSRDSLTGLTLGHVLGCEKRPGPVQVNRTLLDIIRDDSSGGSYRDLMGQNNKKSWKSFKDRLRLRRAGAAWTSSVPIPTSDVPIQNCRAQLSRQMSRQVSRQMSRRDSVRVTNHTLTTAPETPQPSQSSSSITAENETEPPLTRRLSAALAAEREQQQSTAEEAETEATEAAEETVETEVAPVRMSLMALLEETDRQAGLVGSAYAAGEEDEEEEEEDEVVEEEGGGGGGECSCCVCMVRHKGAAFIPCGHTFCRLCSRELWVSRGNCPLCNGFILEILDIF